MDHRSLNVSVALTMRPDHNALEDPWPSVWSFGSDSTWKLVRAPVRWPDRLVSLCEASRILEDHGYGPIVRLGEGGKFSVEVFGKGGGYLASVWVLDDGAEVVLNDFPSLLAFLRYLEPLIRLGREDDHGRN
jgi:hypothetical protein